MMKMTEQTTLAELQAYLRVCGDPFVTLMAGSSLTGEPRKLHAVVHVPNVGTFHGGGDTVAEALEVAFSAFRRATLPEGLKQILDAATAPCVVCGKPLPMPPWPIIEGSLRCLEHRTAGPLNDVGGPTLGGEDLSPDHAIRREQIRAVVMGELQPSKIGVSLAEQTKRLLDTLTPREREVLHQRMETGRRATRDPAFNKFRQTADEVESEADQYDRATGDLGRPILNPCHGCGHTKPEHPNESGCQKWHDK